MEISPEYDLNKASWHKSSYSGGEGGDCLEIARWQKSTYSDASGGDCLEVSDDFPHIVPVRDSKNPDGPVLVFPAAAWSAFIEDVRA
ncbi:DUF397 domain-containing protein [Streptomyces violascens]|uniref:DUF397 domain-containing protein n=1 Tax=Streptomyces violascens TaxID=67381 RepID=UPI0037B5D742